MTLFKKSPITFVFLGITSFVFLAMQLWFFGNSTSGEAILLSGGMLGALVRFDPTQLWRLVTPIFVHIGWEHFLLNSLALYFVGQRAEQIYGSVRFLFLYLLSGIAGNVACLVFSPLTISAGASTSLFGIFSALAILGQYSYHPFLRQQGRSFQILIVLNLIFNLFSPDVSLLGHLGGIFGGVLVAFFLPNLLEPRLFSSKTRLIALGLYLVLTLGLVSLVLFF